MRNNPLAFVDPDGNLAWFVAPLVGGALIGGTISTLAYVGVALASGQDITPGGVAGAFVSGAVAGAVSVFATPLAGTAVKAVGIAASNSALAVGSTVVNAAGGAVSYVVGGTVENAVNTVAGYGNTFQPTASGAFVSAATAGTLNVGLSKSFPVANNTMRTVHQAEHFMPGRNPATIVQAVVGRGSRNAIHLYQRQIPFAALLGTTTSTAAQMHLIE